jgi:hypothetical protein
MIDYLSLSVIYIIKCKDEEITDTYIGSTINMRERERNHRRFEGGCETVYKFIKDNGSWNNFEFYLLEQYKATSKSDLRNREGYWVEKLNPTLNTHTPNGRYVYRDSYYCDICLKDYKTCQSYGEHLVSNKHKNNIIKNETNKVKSIKPKKEKPAKDGYCKECDCFVLPKNYNRHIKTNKHKKKECINGD